MAGIFLGITEILSKSSRCRRQQHTYAYSTSPIRRKMDAWLVLWQSLQKDLAKIFWVGEKPHAFHFVVALSNSCQLSTASRTRRHCASLNFSERVRASESANHSSVSKSIQGLYLRPNIIYLMYIRHVYTYPSKLESRPFHRLPRKGRIGDVLTFLQSRFENSRRKRYQNSVVVLRLSTKDSILLGSVGGP